MQWYEEEVHELEERLRAASMAPDPAIFYGSSTIRLWKSLASDLNIPQALNLGFGGSTLEACTYFFERLVVPVCPASLVVYAGDNDLGDGRSPENVLGSFQALADKVGRHFPAIPFRFISVKASPARFGILDRIRRTNDLIQLEIDRRRTARSQNGAFISVFDAMLDDRGKPRPELFLEDGLHLGPAGYQLWVSLLAPYRDQILNALSTECNSAELSSGQGAPRLSQVVQPPSQP